MPCLVFICVLFLYLFVKVKRTYVRNLSPLVARRGQEGVSVCLFVCFFRLRLGGEERRMGMGMWDWGGGRDREIDLSVYLSIY